MGSCKAAGRLLVLYYLPVFIVNNINICELDNFKGRRQIIFEIKIFHQIRVQSYRAKK